ncbi:TPA: hypothetical protein OTT14_004400 [Klebsiella michiganensis]|nr:hypothetical protein [Klebsiella michiganensis]
MGGNDRNMFHRRVNDTEKKFSPEQNPRLYLLTRVISAASQLFDGNTELMAQWLNKPAKALVSRARNRLWTTSAPCPPTASHGGAGLARRLRQQLRESLWTGEIPFTTTEQGIVVAPNTALNLALRFHQR